jgi:hypothetical protein
VLHVLVKTFHCDAPYFFLSSSVWQFYERKSRSRDAAGGGIINDTGGSALISSNVTRHKGLVLRMVIDIFPHKGTNGDDRQTILSSVLQSSMGQLSTQAVSGKVRRNFGMFQEQSVILELILEHRELTVGINFETVVGCIVNHCGGGAAELTGFGHNFCFLRASDPFF